MDKQRTAQLLARLAERLVPDGADLRPAMRARLAARRGGTPRPTGGRRRLGAIGVLAFVLVLGLPLAAFAAPGALHAQLQRFGVVLVDATLAPTPAAPSRSVATPAPATTTGAGLPWLNLDEAQRQVTFPIRVPTWLPTGLTRRGVLVGSSGAVNGVSLGVKVLTSYRADDGGAGGLHIDQITGAPAGGYGIPATQTRPTLVSGYPATYARGAWQQDGRWDATADAGTLSWADGAFTYVVQYSDLALSEADLLRLAEGLR